MIVIIISINPDVVAEVSLTCMSGVIQLKTSLLRNPALYSLDGPRLSGTGGTILLLRGFRRRYQRFRGTSLCDFPDDGAGDGGGKVGSWLVITSLSSVVFPESCFSSRHSMVRNS